MLLLTVFGVLLSGATTAEPIQWTELIADGDAPFGPRAIPHGGFFNNGSIVFMGGRTGYVQMYNDIWRSDDDGRSWNLVSESCDWEARAYHEATVVNDTIVLLGGQSASEFFNDVWHSYDYGHTWELITEHAPWSGRAGHKIIEYEDEMLLFSGSSGNFPRSFPDDVWASGDLGRTWTLRSASVPWGGRAGMEVVPIDGVLYLMGGDNDNPAWAMGPTFSDVWKSTDNAATWTRVEVQGSVEEGTMWSARTGHKCVTPDDEFIYCIAGANQNGTAGPHPIEQDGVTTILHDVWKSPDGANWEKVSNSAWNCDPTLDEFEHKCGLDDMLLLVMPDGSGDMLTIAGDYESSAEDSPCCKDNSVWKVTLL